jgi:hypothetical protein
MCILSTVQLLSKSFPRQLSFLCISSKHYLGERLEKVLSLLLEIQQHSSDCIYVCSLGHTSML